MPKPSTKLPKVFLACPFDNDKEKLLTIMQKLPWKIYVATDKITNDTILNKVTKEIKGCSFCIFDISGWNSNVCLELGLAKGLGKKYYIINNNTKKKDVPSDIKGIDRIDFNWNKKRKAEDLYHKLKEGIFKKNFITRIFWEHIRHSKFAEKKFTLVLELLARLNGQIDSITQEEIKKMGRGSRLRQRDYTDIINTLSKLGLFKKVQRSAALKMKKKLYR